jgi:hypothetical protein
LKRLFIYYLLSVLRIARADNDRRRADVPRDLRFRRALFAEYAMNGFARKGPKIKPAVQPPAFSEVQAS